MLQESDEGYAPSGEIVDWVHLRVRAWGSYSRSRDSIAFGGQGCELFMGFIASSGLDDSGYTHAKCRCYSRCKPAPAGP